MSSSGACPEAAVTWGSGIGCVSTGFTSGAWRAAAAACDNWYCSKSSFLILTYSLQRVHLNSTPEPVILSSETRKSFLQLPHRTSILTASRFLMQILTEQALTHKVTTIGHRYCFQFVLL